MLAPAEKMRNSPVRLNMQERYALYKYVVEERCLTQVEDLFEFRVPPMRIAKEFNLRKIITKKINSHHVQVSVEEVIEWQKLMDKLPAVPQETAEIEQLRIEVTRVKLERDKYKTELENVQKIMGHKIDPAPYIDLQERVRKIKSILAA